MALRQDIVDAARECLGTPWHHQGRVVGTGIDCVGLLIHICKTVGLPHKDMLNYPRHPTGELIQELDQQVDLKDGIDPVPGDLAVFKIGRAGQPQHLGIIAERKGVLSIVHTYYGVGKAVEHDLDEKWHRRLYRLYAFPGSDEVD